VKKGGGSTVPAAGPPLLPFLWAASSCGSRRSWSCQCPLYLTSLLSDRRPSACLWTKETVLFSAPAMVGWLPGGDYSYANFFRSSLGAFSAESRAHGSMPDSGPLGASASARRLAASQFTWPAAGLFNLCSKSSRSLSTLLRSSQFFELVHSREFKAELSPEMVSDARRLRW
jgi:hypothetical protein